MSTWKLPEPAPTPPPARVERLILVTSHLALAGAIACAVLSYLGVS